MVVDGCFDFEGNILEFLRFRLWSFIEVVTVGDLKIHFFKPFKQEVIFRALM